MIVRSPLRHRRAFDEHVGSVDSALKPLESRGRLRPIVSSTEQEMMSSTPEASTTAAALRLLLYSHEVLLDIDYLPNSFDWRYKENQSSLERKLATLQRIRPLVEDGSIRYTSLESRGRHPGNSALVKDLAKDPALRTIGRNFVDGGLDGDDPDAISKALFRPLSMMRSNLRLAAMACWHALARTQEDVKLREFLLGGTLSEGRTLSLEKLASLQVPAMRGSIDDLVSRVVSG